MSWCQKILNAVATAGPGGFITDFPSYRPDLVENMASQLGFAYVDFRRERMAPLKFEAHKLPLSTMETCIDDMANTRGIVLQNGEALLATKSEAERAEWLQAFLVKPRTCIAVLPLAIYGRDVWQSDHVVRFLPHDLPAETLLNQLNTMRFQ